MTREDAARAFAAAMPGWKCEDGDARCWPCFKVPTGEQCAFRDTETVPIPPANEKLRHHMEFLGRVAEALAPEFDLFDVTKWGAEKAGEFDWTVQFMSTDEKTHGVESDPFRRGTASDPSWAALLAATAAKAEGGAGA